MFGDHGPRIESRPGIGVAAEQPGNGLLLGAGSGTQLAVDVNKRAEQLRMHHAQCQRAGAPADQPTIPQLAGSRLTPKLEMMYGTTSLVR